MASLNKWIGIGHLGADPEVRYLPNGDCVANFRIACSEQWKDKDGNKQERTEWVSLTVFRKLAEIVGEYLKKGMLVYVDGRLRTEKWQDQQGNDRYTTKVYCDTMKILSSRKDGQSDGGGSSAPEQKQPRPSEQNPGGSFDDLDDSIPF